MAEQLGAILPNEARNLVGICHLDVVAVQDVLSVPDTIENALSAPIILKAGATWKRFYFEDDGGLYAEKWTVDNGAMASYARASGSVAKDRLPLLRQFWAANGRRYLVLVTTRNRDVLLMGSLATPVQLQIQERTAGADIDSDRNQYEAAFVVALRHPVPYYLPVPPAPEPGVECPSLAVLLPTATISEIIAGVTAEQLAGLQAYFADDCPTLADLLAGATNEAIYAALTLSQATYIANQVISVIDGNGTPDDIVIDPGGGSTPSGEPDFDPAGFAAADFMTT